MAEMNLKQMIDRLNAEFTGEGRKLVFWYDDKAAFAEDIETMELQNAKIYHLQPDNQFYTKLPIEIRRDKNIFSIILSVIDFDMNIIVQEEDVFFYFNNDFMHFEKGTMKPKLLYYKDNSYNTYITTYFTIELNCVDELKI